MPVKLSLMLMSKDVSASPKRVAETVDDCLVSDHGDKRPDDHCWPGATHPMWHGNRKNPVG